MKRTLAVVAAAALLAGGTAVPASAQADTTAVAINTRDGASIFRLAFSVRRVMAETVDQSNAAVAVASCTDCETVAVAIQVVLIFSDPEVVSPTNLALAINTECSLCDTLASAYQYVFTTDGVVHFTAEGNRRLTEIRNQIRELLASDASIEEVQAGLDLLMDELGQVLATELSEPVAAPSGSEPPTAGPEASPATQETAPSSDETSTTSSPPEDASESPSPPPSPEPTPSSTP